MPRKRPNYENSLAHLYPELANQWDEKKNGDLTPEHVTPGSGKKVWWICRSNACGCTHSWISSICNRMKRSCPYCANNKVCPCKSLATRQDVMKLWHPTKNQGIDPASLSQFCHKIVWWKCQNVRTCDCEHEWQSVVSAVTNGSRCPYCCNQKVCFHNSLAYLDDTNVMEYWHPTKNQDIDPYTISCQSGKVVWWRCSKDVNTCGCHHDWEAPVSRIFGGARCPYCCTSAKKVCMHKSLKYLMPEIMIYWHPTKNIDVDPGSIGPGSDLNVWWICLNDVEKCGCTHEWQSKIENVSGGSRCHYCSNPPSKVCVHNSFAYLRPEMMKFWNYAKNDIDPTQLSVNSNKKVWWKCESSLHDCGCLHEWETRINHVRGCPFCSSPARKVCFHRSLQYLRPDVMKYWNFDKNASFDPKEISIASHNLIWWKCEADLNVCSCIHEWSTTIASLTSRTGCPYCKRKRVCFHNSLFTQKPELMTEWDPSNKLDPKKLHVSSNYMVGWICWTCGCKWDSTINNRSTQNKGCPNCKRSRMEKCIEETLNNLPTSQLWMMEKIIKNSRQLIPPQQLDIYVELQLASKERQFIGIEMDGKQHFEIVERFDGVNGLKERKQLDWEKNLKCQEKRIHLLRIGYDVDKKSYTNIVTQFFDLIANNPTEWQFKCCGNLYD